MRKKTAVSQSSGWNFISEEELLEMLHINARSLRNLRSKKLIPFKTINQKVIVYDPEAVFAALAKFDHVAQ